MWTPTSKPRVKPILNCVPITKITPDGTHFTFNVGLSPQVQISQYAINKKSNEWLLWIGLLHVFLNRIKILTATSYMQEWISSVFCLLRSIHIYASCTHILLPILCFMWCDLLQDLSNISPNYDPSKPSANVSVAPAQTLASSNGKNKRSKVKTLPIMIYSGEV